MKELAAIVIGALFTWLLLHSVLNLPEPTKALPEPTLSACDSIHFANDSLVQKLELLNRRLSQYRVGLGFLKEKDKKAYDYVINAGNLSFPEEL